MNLLEGKTAIITGASRGIGKSIAEKFAENGCNIAFSYASSVEKAQELEKELTSKYSNIYKVTVCTLSFYCNRRSQHSRKNHK